MIPAGFAQYLSEEATEISRLHGHIFLACGSREWRCTVEGGLSQWALEHLDEAGYRIQALRDGRVRISWMKTEHQCKTDLPLYTDPWNEYESEGSKVNAKQRRAKKRLPKKNEFKAKIVAEKAKRDGAK